VFGGVIAAEEDLGGLYGPPLPAVQRKELDHVDRHCREFIARSTLVLVATANRRGRCDVSPRGGSPGFVSVLDERRLLLPDAPGNRRIDSLRNILQTGQAGLLFVIPGLEETLRVNGQAVLVRDQALLSGLELGGKTPRVALGIGVQEVFLHCAKAFKRGAVWSPDRWPSTEGLATSAQILRDHIALAEVTTERVQSFLDEDYLHNLY
jgi:PPOX class probable FMN-dependent enzyme